jgi:hypothetical protein
MASQPAAAKHPSKLAYPLLFLLISLCYKKSRRRILLACWLLPPAAAGRKKLEDISKLQQQPVEKIGLAPPLWVALAQKW